MSDDVGWIGRPTATQLVEMAVVVCRLLGHGCGHRAIAWAEHEAAVLEISATVQRNAPVLANEPGA